MLTKCIGIISYFPDDEPLRTNRKKAFNNFIGQLDKLFKLPIIIVAQNWRKEDYNIKYCATIKIYNFSNALGITKARIILREKLLETEYDYFILFDDDSNIIGTENSVKEYLKQLDNHPDMFGLFKGRSWHRLFAISKYMLNLMSYDFIKNYESFRGEIWEDVAYAHTYKKIYPNKWFDIQVIGLDENQLPSEKDVNTTWYKPEFDNEKSMWLKTKVIRDEWIKSLL